MTSLQYIIYYTSHNDSNNSIIYVTSSYIQINAQHYFIHCHEQYSIETTALVNSGD